MDDATAELDAQQRTVQLQTNKLRAVISEQREVLKHMQFQASAPGIFDAAVASNGDDGGADVHSNVSMRHAQRSAGKAFDARLTAAAAAVASSSQLSDTVAVAGSAMHYSSQVGLFGVSLANDFAQCGRRLPPSLVVSVAYLVTSSCLTDVVRTATACDAISSVAPERVHEAHEHKAHDYLCNVTLQSEYLAAVPVDDMHALLSELERARAASKCFFGSFSCSVCAVSLLVNTLLRCLSTTCTRCGANWSERGQPVSVFGLHFSFCMCCFASCEYLAALRQCDAHATRRFFFVFSVLVWTL
jgi:hypothetical protein